MGKIRDFLKNSAQVDKVAHLAFNKIDTDKNGSISKDELEPVMEILAIMVGIPIPTSLVIHQAMKVLDKDRDGEISFEEFKGLTVQTLNLMPQEEE